MIHVKNLSFGYNKKQEVLKNVDFSIKEGVTLLIGENASGKSTLMKILTGAIPVSDSIYIDDKKLSDKKRKKMFSYLPQELLIYPSLKVRDVLQFVCGAKGLKKADIPSTITEVSQKTNITKFLGHKFNNTSVGTQKRVGIACALIGDPEVIILDEPTAGVDPKERARFYEVISDLFRGKTVLISSHILDDMDILADHVIMLSNGAISFDGDYLTFRHALDNRLYEVVKEDLTMDDERVLKSGIIVRERNTENGRVIRAVIDGYVSPSFKQVSPSLDDIWEYYLRINHGQMDL